MAKKSKAFSELLRLQKRKPQRPQNPLASLEKKLQQIEIKSSPNIGK
jgi:hypothetical protein